MLSAVATSRSPLELWPGPIRLLVLRVVDEDGRLYADLSAATGPLVDGVVGELVQLRVRAGDRFELSGRTFAVSGVHTGGVLGERIEFTEVRLLSKLR
jgi:hypothetical protein